MNESDVRDEETPRRGPMVKYWLLLRRWKDGSRPKYLLTAEIPLRYRALTVDKTPAKKETARWTAGRWEAAWGQGYGGLTLGGGVTGG